MKYKNKYRIESARRPNWDYSLAAAYFVTINVRYHKCLFGKIKNEIMELSSIGLLADLCWMDIPNHFPNIRIDTFIVMPNHLHGIVILEDPPGRGNNLPINISCENSKSKSNPVSQKMSDISPKPGSLPVIIGSYKSSVTKDARKFEPKYEWQARYHDHIIRDEREYQRITAYIINNPKKWKDDEFFRKK